jgi:KaiC/GvpD/RAD55 family RecA-like ATPase
MARPRTRIVDDLAKQGIDVASKEQAGVLRVDDWYSPTLNPEQSRLSGPGEAYEIIDRKYARYSSVHVGDLNISMLRQIRKQVSTLPQWSDDQSGVLAIVESFSVLLRFNEEKAFLEWFENRNLPLQRELGRVNLHGFGRGLHSEWFYRRLENVADGVLEVKSMERDDQLRTIVRVSGLKGQPHDARWHEIEIRPNGEAVLSS